MTTETENTNTPQGTEGKQPAGPDIIVGIGASAGGLEALQQLFTNLPDSLGSAAILVAQHLSPTYKSQLVELLSRHTSLVVLEAKDEQLIQPDHIYITPPDSEISVNGSTISLTRPRGAMGPRPSVNNMFASIAGSRKEKAVAIVLSGTGTDGSAGLKDIKAENGIVIVQDPESAKYDGMPAASIETGLVDIIMTPDRIGRELYDLCRSRPVTALLDDNEDEGELNSLQGILKLLSERTGTDFSKYKSATIGRRLERRLATLGVETLEEYFDVLKTRPGELDALFNSILIGVTYFFRDTESFQKIRECIESIVEQTAAGERIRCWVAGCATGEEPYSIALTIADVLGDKFKKYDIQIFATDIDEKALSIARKGVYSKVALENVPDEMLSRFFTQRGNDFEISKEIRNLILFSRHDVTNNPPFLQMDLISCRNLLIYFGAELQQHVLPLFHYALKQNGYLFLGKSETIGQFTDLFVPHDQKHKIFRRKRGSVPPAIRIPNYRATKAGKKPNVSELIPVKEELTVSDMVKETFYNSFDHPFVIVDDGMNIVEVFGDASEFLSIRSGQMDTNILKLISPRFELELRSILTQAVRENSSRRGMYHKSEKAGIYNRLVIKPLVYSSNQSQTLFMIICESVDLSGISVSAAPSNGNEPDTVRVEELEKELSATRDHLQSYIEELETSSEELQSLNEELQSTNEELQSSNEELETSNEELQSTNEELQIAYSELKEVSRRTEMQAHKLEEIQNNLEALLQNTRQAFILIDRNFMVILQNDRAAALFEEISGKESLENTSILEILPAKEVVSFSERVNEALSGRSVQHERAIEYQDGRIRSFLWQFVPVKSSFDKIERIAVSAIDITEMRRTQDELLEQKKFSNTIFNSAAIGICVTNLEGNFVRVNDEYCRIYGYTEDELVGYPFTMVVAPSLRDYVSKLHTSYLKGETDESSGEWHVMRKDGTEIRVMVTAGRFIADDGQALKVTTVRDVSAIRKAEEERERIFNVSPDLMSIMRFNGVFEQVNSSWSDILGFAPPEFQGARFLDFIYQADKPAMAEQFKAVLSGKNGVLDFECRMQTTQGAVKWFSWRFKSVAEDRLIYAVARDITDTKEYRDLLRDTQTAARVGGWELDVKTGKTRWTEEVYRIYGLDPSQTVDSADRGLEAYPEGDRELVSNAIKKAQESGEASELEVKFINTRGQNLWVRITMRPEKEGNEVRRIVGTLQDITGRKKVELEHLKLSTVVSSTASAVVITDAGGRVEWVNEAFVSMTGYSLAEIAGKKPGEILQGPDTDPETIERIRAKLKEQVPFTEEILNYSKSGDKYWINMHITPIFDEKGIMTNFVSIQSDISERKESELNLIEARDRAEEMNRLKTHFLANMSHEIRTPLNGILGLARLVEEESKEKNIQEYAQLVNKSGRRLLTTLNQVIDLAKVEANKVEVSYKKINLYETAREVCQSVISLADEKGLYVHLDVPQVQPEVVSDETLVGNILNNLVGNAIKFTSEGGVTVDFGTVDRGEKVFHEIKVTDTGIGISEDYLPNLFDEFTQQSQGMGRGFEGSGLGLTISKRFARLLGGDLEVESEKGKGSTFTLLLPVNSMK